MNDVTVTSRIHATLLANKRLNKATVILIIFICVERRYSKENSEIKQKRK